MKSQAFSRSARLVVLTAFASSLFYFGLPAADFQSAKAGISQKLLRKHNKERKKRNRPRLKRNGALNRAARKYANLMNTTNHPLSHTGPAPEFSEFDDRIKAEGFKRFPIGENIAKGQRSVKQVMRDWMRSRGHRKNILKRKFRTMGGGKSGPYWVVTFGGR